MDHLFCLDNRVIGGAPDRIVDVADLFEHVDQQLLLRHIDPGKAATVGDDVAGVAERVGAFDELTAPGRAGQELAVDRLSQRPVADAFRRVAAVGSADIGNLDDQVGDDVAERKAQILVSGLGVLQGVVQPSCGDDIWRCAVLQQRIVAA
jgi:hypothetical protein